jgi:hypothetical protein
MPILLSNALFSEIRPEFFRILAGPAARLYVDALDALERVAVHRVQGIEREDALALVEQAAEEHTSVPLDEYTPAALGTREKARSALEHLVQAGWLEEEQLPDWQRLMHFHPTGIALMRILREIAFPKGVEFSDKLVSVCATLTQYDAANDPLLKEPWQHVESCIASLQVGISELRSMQKAIERHTRQQLEAATLKENLAVLFDQFAERIGHTCYAELVRARLPIRLTAARRRVEELDRDADLLGKMQHEVLRRNPSITPDTGMSRVRLRLEELADLLEGVIPVADAVDRRTAEFTRRSLARFRYLQETTSQNRTRVQEFFESLNHHFAGKRLAELDDALLEFPGLNIYDPRLFAGLESLYRPRLRRIAGEIEALDDEATDAQKDHAMSQLHAAIRDSLTMARANRFIERLLPERGMSIRSEDLPLRSEEDLADLMSCLLHAHIRGAIYKVDVQRHLADADSSNYDMKLRYLIEQFTLRRI